ncbi:MAG: hypothetical protein H6559_10345 [Lewinellaceae bacterium]|nr:hypothetical protein [Lewinellaceae bacterium]
MRVSWYAALKRQGFREADIAVLRDEQATRQGIMDAIRSQLADKARRRRCLLSLLHLPRYQQVADSSGDEVDGYDEIVSCPTTRPSISSLASMKVKPHPRRRAGCPAQRSAAKTVVGSTCSPSSTPAIPAPPPMGWYRAQGTYLRMVKYLTTYQMHPGKEKRRQRPGTVK